MSKQCSECGNEAQSTDVFCQKCGSRLPEEQPEVSPVEATEKVLFCAKCGQAAVPGASFCAHCGAGLQDVSLGNSGEGTQPQAPASTANSNAFDWKWFFKSMGIFVLASIGSALIACMFDDPMVPLLILTPLTLFGVGYVVARLSPGVTIREPAAALAALAVPAGFLQGGGLVLVVLSAALNFGLGFAGAKLGEKHQAAKVN